MDQAPRPALLKVAPIVRYSDYCTNSTALCVAATVREKIETTGRPAGLVRVDAQMRRLCSPQNGRPGLENGSPGLKNTSRGLKNTSRDIG